MKHIRKAAALVVLSTLSVYGTAAMAQAQGAQKWYAGAALGQSETNYNCPSGFSCDKSDTAWRIFGGYKFHPNFSAEVAYTDFGKSKGSINFAGLGSTTFDAKANAFELDGVGTWPLANKFGIYGKLGIYRAKVDSNITGTVAIAGFSTSSSASTTNTGLTFGVGATYDITPTISARVEWQRYNSVGSDSLASGKGDLDVLSVGGLFKF